MSEKHNAEKTPAVTQSDLFAGLRRIGVASGDVALVHSSLSAFGRVEGGADAVIDAVIDAVARDGTVVFPAFTWRAYHDISEPVVFDMARESVKEEVGLIPETFRNRPGVIRSPHLCHSVCALGPQARDVMGDGTKSWGPGSSFGQLEELDVWNLLLGVGTGVCTAIHHVEDLMQVPYRHYRGYEGSTIIYPDGRREACRSIEFLPEPGIHQTFPKMEAVFAERGVLRATKVGNAKVLGIRMRDLVRVTKECLQKDIYFLCS